MPAHSEPDGSDWPASQWCEAVLGELGEYANIHKKFVRGDITEEEFRASAAPELADVVCYLDILASQLGIDLGEAVIRKFNLVSVRVDSDVFLTTGYEDPLRQVERREPQPVEEPRTVVADQPSRIALLWFIAWLLAGAVVVGFAAGVLVDMP